MKKLFIILKFIIVIFIAFYMGVLTNSPTVFYKIIILYTILYLLLYALFKWNKPLKIKIATVVGGLILWQIFTMIAFITSASLIANFRPYCILIYNEEYKITMDKYYKDFDNELKKRGISSYDYEKQREVRDDIPYPKISSYRSVKHITDIMVHNLFKTHWSYGNTGRYYDWSFYALLQIGDAKDLNYYNWSHKFQFFVPRDNIRNYGIPPKGSECTPKRFFIFKAIFNF